MNFLNMNTLSSKKVLLTGLLHTCKKAAVIAEEYNAEAVIFPLQKTKALKYEFEDLYDWIIFTSPAAIRHFFEAAQDTEFSHAACVGTSTETALNRAGFSADLVPKMYNSKALASELRQVIKENSSVIYPCSALADSTMENELKDFCSFARADIYIPEEVEKKELPEFTDAVFFSASAVRVMHRFYGSKCLKDKRVAAIGEKTAKEVRELFNLEPTIGMESTAESTLRALLGPSKQEN